jgi:hypothetical protein
MRASPKADNRGNHPLDALGALPESCPEHLISFLDVVQYAITIGSRGAPHK